VQQLDEKERLRRLRMQAMGSQVRFAVKSQLWRIMQYSNGAQRKGARLALLQNIPTLAWQVMGLRYHI